MDAASFEKYLTDRYFPQIDWYDQRSTFNKRWYVIMQWTVIVLSAVIPVVTAMIIHSSDKWLPAALGAVLTIGTAGLKAFKLQENWINYRTIAETLKKEKPYYDARISEYRNAADPEGLFVERVEALISRENSLWITAHEKKETEAKPK